MDLGSNPHWVISGPETKIALVIRRWNRSRQSLGEYDRRTAEQAKDIQWHLHMLIVQPSLHRVHANDLISKPRRHCGLITYDVRAQHGEAVHQCGLVPALT